MRLKIQIDQYTDVAFIEATPSVDKPLLSWEEQIESLSLPPSIEAKDVTETYTLERNFRIEDSKRIYPYADSWKRSGIDHVLPEDGTWAKTMRGQVWQANVETLEELCVLLKSLGGAHFTFNDDDEPVIYTNCGD